MNDHEYVIIRFFWLSMEMLGVKVAYEDIESAARLTPWPAVKTEKE